MDNNNKLYFFRCSVSDDLYAACTLKDGSPLPTPGGGAWNSLAGIEALEMARHGFVDSEARAEIEKWGCHWFTSTGSTDIKWGPAGPPSN